MNRMKQHTKQALCAGVGALFLLLCACSGSAPAAAVIGGGRVTRDEARFVLHTTAQRYAMYTGTEVNWNGALEGRPAADVLRDMTLNSLITARVLRDKTGECGCPLTEEDTAWVEEAMAEDEADYGGAAAFDKHLKSLGGTRELYRLYLYEVSLMEDNLIEHLFGEDGLYAPDDAALEAFCAEHMARCSYIFFSLTGEDHTRLTGEDHTRLKAVAEAVRREAVRYETPGSGAPNPDFADLVAMHGQDYVMSLAPEGFTIPKDFHGDAFRGALEALRPGEISPVVETPGGLYILLRLDPDPEYLTEYRAEAEDAYRLFAYETRMAQWKAEVSVSLTDEFHKLRMES